MSEVTFNVNIVELDPDVMGAIGAEGVSEND